MQHPVEISQVLTTPSPSHEKAIPSFVCRVTHFIGAKVRVVDFGSVTAGFTSEVLICQNLADLSSNDEMREEGEENARLVIQLVGPTKVSMIWGSEPVMSQTQIVLLVAMAMSLPLGEKQQ